MRSRNRAKPMNELPGPIDEIQGRDVYEDLAAGNGHIFGSHPADPAMVIWISDMLFAEIE